MTGRIHVGVVVPGWRGPDAPPALPALEDLIGGLAALPDVDLRIVALRHPSPRGHYRDTSGVPVSTEAAGVRAGVTGRALLAARAVRTLMRLHHERPFDVLHAFWVDEPGAIAVTAGRLLGLPVAVSAMGGELVGLQDIGYGATLGAGGRISSQVTGRGAGLVTVGSGTQFRTVAAWMPELPLRQVPLGVDTERFRPATGLRREARPRVLAVGSLVPVKDHVLLLRAFAVVRDPSAELVIAGDGPLRAGLERLAAGLSIADRVRFLGSVPRADLPELYRSSSVLAVTSRHEAQSMVAVEAAACGLPVAGTAVGVVPELASAGGGVAVDDASPIRIAAALDVTLGVDRGPGLAAAARAHALAAWRLDVAVERFAGIWRDLAVARRT